MAEQIWKSHGSFLGAIEPSCNVTDLSQGKVAALIAKIPLKLLKSFFRSLEMNHMQVTT